MAELRVADFGRVSPLRSQTLWHAVAYGVSAGAPATLSFMRPSGPYVGLGYHRRLEEADLDACRRAGLPVYRRMVGGGVVYLDEHQQFFQICLPQARVPRGREAALRLLLAPAVAAFRAVGVPAELDDDLEIVVGQAKVCGHGAAQIDDAVVVVGNLLERFDHEAAARVLALPPVPPPPPPPEAAGGAGWRAADEVRGEVLRLMRHYVTATPADPDAFRAAAVSAYSGSLGLEPVPGGLTPYEERRLAELDRRFTASEWLQGPPRPEPACTQVKVRAGVWVLAAASGTARAAASVVGGRIERAWVSDPGLNGTARRVEDRLRGMALAEAGAVLDGYGEAGRRLAGAFAKMRGDGR